MIGAIIAHALTSWLLAFARYHSLHNRTFDLALYGRMAWGMVHGQLADPVVGGHALSGHVPLVLWPLGWLGNAFGTVPVLLFAQSVAVAAAAWPLYRMGARHLGHTGGALVAFAWLLYPNLGHVTTYEMHPGTLAVYPLCAAFDALDRRRGVAVLGFCALALACRASMALTTAVIGVLALWPPRDSTPGPNSDLGAGAQLRRAGLCVVLGSGAYLAFVQLWLTPRYGAALGASLDLHFGRWGGGPGGIVSALLQRPADVAEHFASPRRWSYPLRVLAPLGLLPLLAPRLLLCAAPTLALNLISEFPTTTELYSHYLTPAVPALLAATVPGVIRASHAPRAWLRHRSARSWQAFARSALGVATLSASVARGGLPWSLDFAAADFRSDDRSRAEAAVLDSVPADASIQAPDRVLPHLCERPRLHRAPPPERGTDYVMLDVSHRRRFAAREDLLRTLEEPLTRAWLARGDHGLVRAGGDLLLLRRGEDPRGGVGGGYFVAGRASGAEIPLTPCLALVRAELGTALTLEFSAHAACAADLALRWGSSPTPSRVELLFDGLLSPAQLRAGDRVRSHHALSPAERARLLASGLHVGLLRADGNPPAPTDPRSVLVPITAGER